MPLDSTPLCRDCGVPIGGNGSTGRCRGCVIRARTAPLRDQMGIPNPSGLCMCGCGQETMIAKQTDAKEGTVLGCHKRFINGHRSRGIGIPYVIDPVTGCHIWQRGRNRDGYGTIKRNGRNMHAHQFFFEQKYGPVPKGLELDHIVCSNRACCNPDHVTPTTHIENSRRRLDAKLTIEMAREIRALNGVMSRSKIAERYGVTKMMICHIIKGRAWREI